MKKYDFEVGDREEGQRLDQFLMHKLPKAYSRSFVQRLIEKGNVLVNDQRAKSHHKVKAGERVALTPPPPARPGLIPEDISLDIVYEDDDLVVVNKRPGIVVHPAVGNYSGTLVNGLLFHCKKLSALGGPNRPGIVHRLDKDTSGLLVAAKTDLAYTSLARQFRTREIRRKYIALVEGEVELDEGTIELPIGRHPRKRQRMAVTFTRSKFAITHYKVLKRYKDFTAVEVKLKTGRTHQIRVHLAYIGHPVLGDARYGIKGLIARQALHAALLGFRHPKTDEYLEFTAELPSDMRGLIQD